MIAFPWSRRAREPTPSVGRGCYPPSNLRRADLLLSFLDAPSALYEADQIRIMKGLFLLSRGGPGELQNLYAFEPYDYGPFDRTVYADLDGLMLAGLVQAEGSLSSNRRTYRLTDSGRARAAEVRGTMEPAVLDAVYETKELVTSMSFNELLRYVYRKHPDMATRSKHDVR